MTQSFDATNFLAFKPCIVDRSWFLYRHLDDHIPAYKTNSSLINNVVDIFLLPTLNNKNTSHCWIID